ncbi:MAG: hypothetical protein CL758_08690 [Chloroflexi bacterium]|nr:hypothetical protein [Chloroflexota bacterium]|tara:strand:- start:2447 stop:3040 length:594 start_codon:yes stop_codon:yes gene_type:complete
MVFKFEDPVVIGITGASGSSIGYKTVQYLLENNYKVIVTMSSSARLVWKQEMDESFGEVLEKWSEYEGFKYFSGNDMSAPIASGSFKTLGMAIVPCSMNTVASISQGITGDLVKRAADVSIKEDRPLVIIPRESPLNTIHLENMTKLSKLGIKIIPVEPPFYLKFKTIDEVIDFTVQRTLLALNLIDRLPEYMVYKS